LSLKYKHATLGLLLLNCPKVKHLFMTDSLSNSFDYIRYTISRLYNDRVQLSINLTKALFHKYFVAIKYR